MRSSTIRRRHADLKQGRPASRQHLRRPLLSAAPGNCAAHARGHRAGAARPATSPASTPAATSSAACTRRRPTRSSAASSARSERRIAAARADTQQGASRTCSTPRASTSPLFRRRPRHPRLGRAHDELRPGVEVRQRAPAASSTSSTRSTSGTQWAVFEPNDEPLWAHVRRDDRRTSCCTVWRNGALAGRRRRGGVLRQVRPHDDDPERPRQRPADLPDRRRAASSRPSS